MRGCLGKSENIWGKTDEFLIALIQLDLFEIVLAASFFLP